MSLLKLPKEILRVIWRFIVDVRDIIRFGSTCKLIQSLAYEVDRDLYINDGAPIELWKHVFSQDLRRLTSLVVNMDLYPNNSEYISSILDILPIISNCRSLKTLTMVITETYEDPDFNPTFQKLSAAIKQMTWLEYLCIGFTIDYNIGEYFKDHSKLTCLSICEKNADGIGYEKLTQIKRLRISCNAGDDILQQVLDLTNLTDLDLRDSLVTKKTTKQLWKLTNLEIMDISGLEIGDRVDWRVLKKLPKLSTLIHERDHNSSIPYEEYQYDIMNSLTQLTLLGIRTGFGHPFPLEKISNLTNLRALSVAVNSSYEDFAKFQNLTYLNVTLGKKVERIQFPKELKIMAIDTFPHKDAIFKEIGDLDSLTELSLYYPDTKKLHHISRLTNLEWLTFGKEQLSPEFFGHLTSLSNLRGLSLSYPPKVNINLLQQLTQLYKLNIDSASTEEMTEFRKKLPCAVYCNATYRHYNYKKDSMLMFIPYLFALGLWYILHTYVFPTLGTYIFSEGRIDLVGYIREFLYYLKNIFT